ncbi:hypothetical protein ZWY2020_007757 [Hordeum vulgare]|nr:hypothetical protein ZWY2020_007757 [Hordeum vulgare]
MSCVAILLAPPSSASPPPKTCTTKLLASPSPRTCSSATQGAQDLPYGYPLPPPRTCAAAAQDLRTPVSRAHGPRATTAPGPRALSSSSWTSSSLTGPELKLAVLLSLLYKSRLLAYSYCRLELPSSCVVPKDPLLVLLPVRRSTWLLAFTSPMLDLYLASNIFSTNPCSSCSSSPAMMRGGITRRPSLAAVSAAAEPATLEFTLSADDYRLMEEVCFGANPVV